MGRTRNGIFGAMQRPVNIILKHFTSENLVPAVSAATRALIKSSSHLLAPLVERKVTFSCKMVVTWLLPCVL